MFYNCPLYQIWGTSFLPGSLRVFHINLNAELYQIHFYIYTDWYYELAQVQGLSSVSDVMGSRNESAHLETASLGSVEVTCRVIQDTSLWRDSMSHSMFSFTRPCPFCSLVCE